MNTLVSFQILPAKKADAAIFVFYSVDQRANFVLSPVNTFNNEVGLCGITFVHHLEIVTLEGRKITAFE